MEILVPKIQVFVNLCTAAEGKASNCHSIRQWEKNNNNLGIELQKEVKQVNCSRSS